MVDEITNQPSTVIICGPFAGNWTADRPNYTVKTPAGPVYGNISLIKLLFLMLETKNVFRQFARYCYFAEIFYSPIETKQVKPES